MPLIMVKHQSCPLLHLQRQYLLTCHCGWNSMPNEYAAVRINSMADTAQQAAIEFGALTADIRD